VNENKELKDENHEVLQRYNDIKKKLDSFCSDKKSENEKIKDKIN